MKFCSLGSSSFGNCHYIETEDTKILVDCGFSGKRTEGLLGDIGVKGQDLGAILVTHEHTDHIKGVGILSRRYNLPIYANEKTWASMEKDLGKIDKDNRKVFKSQEFFQLGDLDILPIRTYHDAAEPVGYVFHKGRKKLSIITDTGRIDGSIMDSIRASDLYLIESNHDIQMLRDGSYPYNLKERVLSDLGHLSNVDAANILANSIRGQGETLLLGHISKDNNTPRRAFNETAFRLMDLGLDIRSDVNLGLTYRDKRTEVFNI